MRIAGIIAEYNPFHKGHAWHIAETRRRTGCDSVVVCMDGHFTQRGEPALFSKWARAGAALRCGADAVFELPALFAVRAADAFARGGVAILGGLGADILSFGCETDDIHLLETLAELGREEPAPISEGIRRGLREGMTHARARGVAVAEYLDLPEEWMNRPNLILATEYLRAIRACASSMAPLAVPRQGGYHDGALREFASASAIRAAFVRGEDEAALACLPEPARMFPDRLHPMDDLLMARLRSMEVQDMARLPDVSEGLERRLYRLCREESTRENLLSALKCKRYTHARLSRMLTHALLGVTREMTDAHPLPAYARLLGMRRGAEPLLAELNKRSTIPIVSNPAQLKGDCVFRLECHATDLWALLHDEPEWRRPGREFTEKFIRI